MIFIFKFSVKSVLRSCGMLALMLALLPGCRPPSPPGDAVAYADLKSFTEAFIAANDRNKAGLKKIIQSAEGTDTVFLAQTNWAAELAAFQAYDLAHPVLRGQYRVDSTRQAGRTRVHYRATKPELVLQEAVLVREGSRPVWFRLSDSTDNIMYRSNKTLSLHLDSGLYRIDIEQRSWLFRELEQHIQGAVKR
jgi:hypothetical protein